LAPLRPRVKGVDVGRTRSVVVTTLNRSATAGIEMFDELARFPGLSHDPVGVFFGDQILDFRCVVERQDDELPWVRANRLVHLDREGEPERAVDVGTLAQELVRDVLAELVRDGLDSLVHFPKERLVLSHPLFACVHVVPPLEEVALAQPALRRRPSDRPNFSADPKERERAQSKHHTASAPDRRGANYGPETTLACANICGCPAEDRISVEPLTVANGRSVHYASEPRVFAAAEAVIQAYRTRRTQTRREG
jgi:hypothetical protein